MLACGTDGELSAFGPCLTAAPAKTLFLSGMSFATIWFDVGGHEFACFLSASSEPSGD